MHSKFSTGQMDAWGVQVPTQRNPSRATLHYVHWESRQCTVVHQHVILIFTQEISWTYDLPAAAPPPISAPPRHVVLENPCCVFRMLSELLELSKDSHHFLIKVEIHKLPEVRSVQQILRNYHPCSLFIHASLLSPPSGTDGRRPVW